MRRRQKTSGSGEGNEPVLSLIMIKAHAVRGIAVPLRMHDRTELWGGVISIIGESHVYQCMSHAVNILEQISSLFSDFLKYWTRTWNWRYGNCFSFNSGATHDGKKAPVFTSTKPGPKYGKEIVKFNLSLRFMTLSFQLNYMNVNNSLVPKVFRETL